jgi:hypothetical protein
MHKQSLSRFEHLWTLQDFDPFKNCRSSRRSRRSNNVSLHSGNEAELYIASAKNKKQLSEKKGLCIRTPGGRMVPPSLMEL